MDSNWNEFRKLFEGLHNEKDIFNYGVISRL